MPTLTVATCQFPVSADIGSNLRWVRRQLRQARVSGADVAHFSEGALSGYATANFEDFDDFPWDELRKATEQVMKCAADLGTWVVLGSAHRLSDDRRPHNSMYVIDPSGEVVDRYDKRFCAGADEHSGELAVFTPGDRRTVWEIGGVRCGALICHEYRYPELHREYKRAGVDVVFHSFHAASASPTWLEEVTAELGPELRSANPASTYTLPAITMPASMTAAAAASHLWISCANSSAPESAWPSFAVRPDGVTLRRLRRNRPGVLSWTVDTDQPLYDSTAAWRQRAMNGVLHSGSTVDDPRSSDRRSI